MKKYNFNINFIVHSPSPEYISHIGGIAVAHSLAHELSLLGENVYIYANSTDPKYDKVNCIPWGTDIKFDPENTIIIIVAGSGEHTFEHLIPDSLKNAPNIVRWLVHNQQKLYPKENKLYMHTRLWDTLDTQNIDGDLCIFDIDLELFRDYGWKREGSCYLIKGNLDIEPERAIHKPEDYCIDLSLYNIPNLEKRKYLAQLFNQKEYFITYTPITLTSLLAAMCGCKSIIVPKSNYNKERWFNGAFGNPYGIAFGLDDLPRAISTMDKVIPNVKNYINNIKPSQLNTFISDCYKWVTEKYNINF
jgi:hypothetical protein